MVLIANPAARDGLSGEALGRARAVLASGDWSLDEQTSESAEHLSGLASAAARDDDVAMVVVAGGDGTVHAAIQGVVTTDKPFAILPVGTGNDFARNLGLPLDPRAAAEVVLRGKTRLVDAGRVSEIDGGAGRYFGCVAGVGLDAVAIAYIRAAPWLRGRFRYTYGGLRALLVYKARRLRVTAGPTVLDRDVMFVATTNTRTYGAGMQVNPQALIDDGALDVCVVGRMGRLKMLLNFPRVYAGTHLALPEVETLRAARVTLETDTPLQVCLDGELTSLRTPVVCEAVPGALRIVVA